MRKTASLIGITVLLFACGCSEEVSLRGDAANAADDAGPVDGDGGAGIDGDGPVSIGDAVSVDRGTDLPPIPSKCVPVGTVLEVGSGKQYQTIGSAISAAGANSTVLVADGTYPESLTIAKGGKSSSARLTICAENSRKAIVRSTGRVLDISAPWVTVQGFVIDGNWGSKDVVSVDDSADELVLRDLEVRNSTADGIDIGSGSSGGCENILIDGCTVHHMLAGSTSSQVDAHCIVATDFKQLTIRNTEAYYCSGDSVQVGTDRDRWDGLLIEGCHLWTGPLPAAAAGFNQGDVPGENALDTKADIHSSPWNGTFHLRDSTFNGFDPKSGYIANRAALNLKNQVTGTVERCTLYDNEIAFRLRGAGSNGGVTGLLVKNNVLYRNQFHVRVEDDAQDVSWLHNTFGQLIDGNNNPIGSNPSSYQSNIFKGGGGGDEGSGWSTNNNLYLYGRPGRATGDGDQTTSDTSTFVDFANHDYHLATQMNADDPVGVQVDRDGKARSATNPDVGAYEL